METKILEAIREAEGQAFNSLEEVRDIYSPREILDIWLRYEGFIGYTDTILNVIIAAGFSLNVDDDDFLEM